MTSAASSKQAALSGLTDTPDELGHLCVDILRKTPDAALLAVFASDRIGAAVHRHTDLAHFPPSQRRLETAENQRTFSNLRKQRKFSGLGSPGKAPGHKVHATSPT